MLERRSGAFFILGDFFVIPVASVFVIALLSQSLPDVNI
jgi:hypothetical protein